MAKAKVKLDSTTQKATLKKVMQCISRYRFLVVLSILLAAISVALTLYVPILVGDAIDFIVAAGQVNFDQMMTTLTRVVIVVAITALAQWLMNVINNKITFRVTREVRQKAFAHLQTLPLSYLDAHPSGEIVSRMISDTEQFADGLLLGFTQLFTGVLTIAGTLGFMLSLDWRITLVVVVLTPLSLFAAKFIATRTYDMFKLQSKTLGEQTALVGEMLDGERVVQAFSRERQAVEAFDEINGRLKKYTLRATFFSSLTNPVTRFVNSIVYACVALTGAALSLAGAAMQGLLKNPLADGSTLGVSSGASLGAVCAIAFGVTLPGFPFAGTMVMAILFAFGSLLVILGLSYKLDRSLSTNTIILIGVIFSMFVSSIMSIVITFAADKVQKITFWTMGSLSGSTYQNAAVLALALAVCGAVILLHAQILNAFAVGEDNARQIGVDVKRAKLVLLITVSVLIGVCVSIGGTIGFVGLVTPHMARMLVGPNHRRLLPAAMFGGAVFLMLADLVARTLLNPLELPIGVVTSFVGAIVFVVIFYQSRKEH